MTISRRAQLVLGAALLIGLALAVACGNADDGASDKATLSAATGDGAAYDAQAARLVAMFERNFARFDGAAGAAAPG